MIWIKGERQIQAMRDAGKLTAETLELLSEHIKPGISTNELDAIAEKFILKNGALASFKNYQGYPKSICASVNSVVVHGIPDDKTILRDGDIISIDCGVYYHGFHGDSARTFAVGEISPDAKKLIETTKKCFYEGMKHAVIDGRMGDIGSAVQRIAEAEGYGVIRDLVGHGVGAALHEDPDVPNFGIAGRGIRLKKGMVIAIEPMINAGTYKVSVMDDGWTVKTNDGKLSSHYENTIAITDNGPEILTRIP